MFFVSNVVVGFVLIVLRSVVGFRGIVLLLSFYLLVFVNFLRLFLFIIGFFNIVVGILVGIGGIVFVFDIVFVKFLFDVVFVVEVVMLGMGYC